jgi:hypothetical protein
MERPITGQFSLKPLNSKAFKSEARLVLKRPVSAAMSSLSIQENIRQQDKKLLASQDPLLKSFEALKKSKMNQFSMPESEISKMLVRLDRITRNTMYGQKKIELIENEKVFVELFAGESQFAFVNTRGETCPLNVMIKRNSGVLETYLSRKIKEPSRILNDEVHHKDYIKVNDKSFFFITPFVAFNFTAVKDSNFSISIKFGQNNVTRSIRSESAIPQNVQVLPTTTTEDDSSKKKLPDKNFIKMNLTLTNFKSKDFRSAEKRRHEVIERHRHIMIETHEKKLYSMKKQEIRLDAELKGKEIIEVIRRKQTFEKFWLKLTKIGTSILHIRKLVRENRVKRLKSIKQKTAVRVIQRKFRKHLKKHPIQKNLLIMSLFSLKNFYRISGLFKRFSHKSLISCIRKAKKNYIMPEIFGGFVKKVILIQKTFREYLVLKEIRNEELHDCWVHTLTKRLEKIHSYKKKSKKWKKKQIEKYSSITEEIQKRILSDHLVNAMKKYLETLQEYRSRFTEKITVMQRKKFLESEIDAVNYLCPPIFKFIPNYKEMLSLIDLVVGSADDGD